MIARVADLPKTPAAFREYVRDWFRPCDVVGVPCVVAEGRLHVNFNDYSSKGRSPGFAPIHGVDTACYKAGLPKAQDLNDWMRKNDGKLVWTLRTEDPRSRVYVDED
jgi:hypothetical protein